MVIGQSPNHKCYTLFLFYRNEPKPLYLEVLEGVSSFLEGRNPQKEVNGTLAKSCLIFRTGVGQGRSSSGLSFTIHINKKEAYNKIDKYLDQHLIKINRVKPN